MYEVAQRAGVGQATLYRNFPDRRSLAAALMTEYMRRIEQLAVEHTGDPDAFFTLLRSVIENMAGYYSLGELARKDECLGSELERQRQRLAGLMKEPLRRAKAAGTIRRDLTIDDVFLIIAMARGAMESPNGRASAGSRALALALEGAASARATA
jgi:AcrR family transcriptional regulator